MDLPFTVNWFAMVGDTMELNYNEHVWCGEDLNKWKDKRHAIAMANHCICSCKLGGEGLRTIERIWGCSKNCSKSSILFSDFQWNKQSSYWGSPMYGNPHLKRFMRPPMEKKTPWAQPKIGAQSIKGYQRKETSIERSKTEDNGGGWNFKGGKTYERMFF